VLVLLHGSFPLNISTDTTIASLGLIGDPRSYQFGPQGFCAEAIDSTDV
jgi:hypothetical protein